jgi:outer membrane immunogenic protein
MNRSVLAAVFVLGSGLSAFAADMVEEVVVVDTAYNWSGVYVGANLGWAWTDTDITDLGSLDDAIFFPGFTTNFDADGVAVGAHAGYNYQLSNNVVVGGEVDFVWTDANDATISDLDSGDGQVGDDYVSTSLDWYGTVRGRLGYAADRFLPYVTGGLAFGRVDVSIGDLDGGVPDDDDFVSGSSTQVGWVLGAGLDYAFTDKLIGRVEYLYMDLGDETYTNADGDSINFDTNVNTIRTGMSYRF